MQTAQNPAPVAGVPEDAEAPLAPPPYRWALGAGLSVFVLYAVTLARTTQFWDTSEYIATGHIVGPGRIEAVLFA